MSTRGKQAQAVISNPIITGSIIVLVAVIGVIVSYGANRGLPFIPTYDVVVEVPDAAELIAGNSEVRLGGARVGLVQEIQAVQGTGDAPPFARLRLSLDEVVEGLPTDTKVMVRPRSLLGAKYLQVTPGQARSTVEPGGTLPLEQATPLVEIDEAFNAFDPETRRGLQRSVIGLGDGVAGRGSAVNSAIGSLGRSMPGLERVLATLAEPGTDLAGFIEGVADVGGGLAPVAPELGQLVRNGATTFGALDRSGPQLEQSLVQLPPTETTGTRTLTRLTPVLADAAGLVRDIRPATQIIGRASQRLAASLRDSTPPLRRLPDIADPAITTLRSLERLARRPSTNGALNGLTEVVGPLGSALRTLTPSQVSCNIGPIFFRNAGSSLSQGDAMGHFFTFAPIFDVSQSMQRATPSPNLHSNPYPNQNASECEAGNEPFEPGIRVGSPGGAQSNRTDETAPPAGVRARARRAGLLGAGGAR